MSEDAQDVVLIVEDDPSILMVLSAYLSGEGYRVLQAENGEQAFEILASKPHLDLMVTDFRLPGDFRGTDRRACAQAAPGPESHFYQRLPGRDPRHGQPHYPDGADPGQAVRPRHLAGADPEAAGLSI